MLASVQTNGAINEMSTDRYASDEGNAYFGVERVFSGDGIHGTFIGGVIHCIERGGEVIDQATLQKQEGNFKGFRRE